MQITTNSACIMIYICHSSVDVVILYCTRLITLIIFATIIKHGHIDPSQFVGMQFTLEDRIIDVSSQESKDLWFCPPDWVPLTSHARDLFRAKDWIAASCYDIFIILHSYTHFKNSQQCY